MGDKSMGNEEDEYYTDDELPLEVRVNQSWSEYDPIFCVIEKYKDFILNQKQEGLCIPMAYTDWVTLIYRFFGEEPNVVLSPQPLLDCCDYQNFNLLSDFLCDSCYGLVRIEEYPFIWKEKDEPMSLDAYKEADFGKRYFINEMFQFDDKDDIRIWLCHNFMEGGRQYPIIGELNMRDYGEKGKNAPATKAANLKNPPYDSRDGKTKEFDQYHHVIIIYGLDTTNEDFSKHSIYVKNTYGNGWGKDGTSRIVVDDLFSIVVPRFNHAEIEDLRSKEREKALKEAIVSKKDGVLAKSNDLNAACGMVDQTIICSEILDKGELQVAGKERESQSSNQFKDIATVVVQKTINAETRCPYTPLDAILELQKHDSIKRSPMRLKLTLPLQNFNSLEEKLSKWESIIVSKVESGSQYSIVCEMDPGLFHDCDALVRNLQGRCEILANSVHGGGDINADHYDGHDDVSSSESKKPTDTVDKLSGKIQKQALAPKTDTTEKQICEMDSGLFCDFDELAGNVHGRFETLSISVHSEGSINADRYDGHDDVSSSEAKKPTDTADQLCENSKTDSGSENRHH